MSRENQQIDLEKVEEIEVTPEMVNAGVDELREHLYDVDNRYMVESVYRAMAYARLSASPSKLTR